MSQKLDNLEVALQNVLGDKIKRLDKARGELTLTVSAADYLGVCRTLRDHADLKFEQLIDLCGIDAPVREPTPASAAAHPPH